VEHKALIEKKQRASETLVATAAEPRARESTYSWATPERDAALAALLSSGVTVKHACGKLGIPVSSYYDRRRCDEPFAVAVHDALSEYEHGLVSRIDAAGNDPKLWKALAFILENRFPKKWGKAARVELTGKDGGPIKVVAVDVVMRVKAALAAADRDDGET
jgi:hypothetical protein